MTPLAEVLAAAGAEGFDPAPLDLAPDEAWQGARGVVLLAAGAPAWAAFRAAPEAADGRPDPLDRWSVRVAAALASRFGARAASPAEGPPYAPFLAWAARAEPVWPSRLGMTLHATHGLWRSWRAALLFAAPLGIVPAPRGPRPCAACTAPCLSACPVGAFGPEGYDAAACARHVAGPEGAECRARGCRARRACPVGAAAAHPPDRAAFHMAAFLRARGLA